MTPLIKPTPRPKAKRAPIARKSRLDRGAPPKRRTRVRKQRAGATAQMRRECDRLASRITLKVGLARCAICAVATVHTRATDTMHILAKKSWPSVRYSLLNLWPGCRWCHERYGSATLIGPSPLREMFIFTRGREAWDQLVMMAAARAPYLPDVHARLKATAQAMGLEKA